MADDPSDETSKKCDLHQNGGAADRVELFVRLTAIHQYQIHRYLLTLIPNVHDAEDLYQQTNLFLWREFERFEEGTSFVSWACSVAYHEVLAWRKKRAKDRLVFSEEFFEAVSCEFLSDSERVERRAEALVRCVEQLPKHHHELLHLRYGEQGSIDSIAGRMGRTTESVYRMLSRIRRALFECVNRALELEAS